MAAAATPFGELRDNTTQDLVADIEVREHLGIERWLVMAAPGVDPVTAYAQAQERATGLIVRGVFLGREMENRWFAEADGVRAGSSRSAGTAMRPTFQRPSVVT